MRVQLLTVVAALSISGACSETPKVTETPMRPGELARADVVAPTRVPVADRDFSTKASSSTDTAGAQGWSTIEYSYRALQIVTDATAPKSPPGAAQVTLRAGTSGGIVRGNSTKIFSTTLQTVNVSLWVKLSSGWVSPSNGKTVLAE